MIVSLDEAWTWYSSVRELSNILVALGQKHWQSLPWDGALGRDERFRELEARTVLRQADVVQRDLDDLAILLLFSVFEASVRDRAAEDVRDELSGVRHPAIQHAVATLLEALESGSFFKVLEPYKSLDADLIEQVNQVRGYRNWVAHDRRGLPSANVTPAQAYDRLKAFLDRLNGDPSR